jgi:hypothetical protein
LLGCVPLTEQTRSSIAVWTPDASVNSSGTVIAFDKMYGEDFALEPFPRILRNTAHDFTSWAMAGTNDPITVLIGRLSRTELAGYESSEYRGASILEPSESSGAKETFGLLGDRVILANSVNQVKAAIDAAVGKRRSLADDETVASLLQTVAPSNALMVIDAAKQAAACAQGDESTVDPSGQYAAVAYGRIGEEGEPRTLVATSFASEDEAASAEAAYELGWQDGYVLAGNSGAPIANFAKVNYVSQSGHLLIAELVEGREDGWTRAAIRFATPVCDAVSEALPNAIVATPEIDEPSALDRALESLPDPGMEGATQAVDLGSAAEAAGEQAPEDLNIRADDIEAWLAKLVPIPSFDAFPTDGTKLARWPETFGIPLGSISAIAETHGADEEQTAAVLVGTWDPEVVDEYLTQLKFARTNWGGATIYTFTGSLDDPSHKINRAADATWSNVAILGDRIFVSPSSRRLREVLDIATGDAAAPTPLDGVYLRDRLLDGTSGVTMVEIVGREFMSALCVDLSVTGVAPEWTGVAAFWTASGSGGNGEITIIPEGAVADARQAFDRQITRDRTLVSASSEPAGGPFSDLFEYRELVEAKLADRTTVLVAKFDPIEEGATAEFFAESVESCRFGA